MLLVENSILLQLPGLVYTLSKNRYGTSLKLSRTESEAFRLSGKIPEEGRRALQNEIASLCRQRWHEIRGGEPDDRLAHAMWMICPPLSDLFLDLYIARDSRLEAVLSGKGPGRGLALLALEETGEGEAEEMRIIHEPLMLFESESIGRNYAMKVSSLLRGEISFPADHPHSSRPPIFKAISLIARRTARCDSPAAVAAMGLLSSPPLPLHDGLEKLREDISRMGLLFLGVDDDHVRYLLRGKEKKPASKRQIAAILSEIRSAWLA